MTQLELRGAGLVPAPSRDLVHRYFAFGSNLDRWQMRRRCPAARVVGTATLPNHRLVFGGFSKRWDCAVATVVRDRGASVPGLVYELGAVDLAALDRVEGAPRIYERVERVVVDKGGKRRRVHLYRLPPKKLVTCTPGLSYFHTIRRAYDRLGFDRNVLMEAAFWEVS